MKAKELFGEKKKPFEAEFKKKNMFSRKNISSGFD